MAGMYLYLRATDLYDFDFRPTHEQESDGVTREFAYDPPSLRSPGELS